MSFSDVVASIEVGIRKIVVSKRLNKNEFSSRSKGLAELASYRARFSDGSVIEKIIAAMPESDFCKIVEVDDCLVGKYHTCTCTKVMVFGNDDVNGKIYEKFTTTTTSSKCRDGNLELAGKCVTTPEVEPCGEMLIKAQQKIEVLAGKLTALYNVMEIPIDF
jgi:hypothetical protein